MWPFSTLRSGVRRLGVVTLALLTAFAFLVTAGAPPAFAVGNESFSVDAHSDGAWGNDFIADATITLTRGTDSCSTVADQWGNFGFDLRSCEGGGSIDLAAGDLVSVTDGVTTKFHTITALVVMVFDPEANVVSGTAEVGSDVFVDIHGQPDAGRTVTATDGTWTTDFDTAGDGGATFDLVAGTSGYANQCDPENDCTQHDWRVPNPTISVRMVEQEIHGYEWEQAVDVTVEIDDPATTLVNPDWTDTKLALPPEWDPTMGFVQFQPFIDDFVVESDFVVTMTQLAVTKTHTVTSLTVTGIDEVDDIVSGTGDEGSPIQVDAWDQMGAGTSRNVTVAGGSWSADFGAGVDTFDIAPDTSGEAAQSDGDGDSTQWSWRVPNPAFSVETPGELWSMNDGWVAGRTVTVTVDEDANPGNGFLYQTATTVESWGPSPWEAGWSFSNFPFTIEAGRYVIADDGIEVAKVLHVVDLTITDIDPVDDDISGTAPDGSFVNVHACDQVNSCEDLTVQAGGGGIWFADFSIDIEPSFGGAAQIYDVDGDSTHRGWQLQEPYFGVDVANEEMWATNWPAGEILTFQVFADDTMGDLLWTDTMEVFGTPWQNTEAGYRFWGEFDIDGGQYFTVTDGVTPKDLVVSTISIAEVNPDGDYYSGTVDPAVPADVGAEVCAWARMLGDLNQGVELCALPDEVTGDWTIDFSGIGDIIPGDHLGVSQRDSDNDETHHSWGVPPWIYIELAEQDEAGVDLYPDRVGLEQWIGPVDIFINDVEVMSDIVTSGEYIQVDLDVEIGQTVRVVDGHDDKSLLIEELTVDNVTAWDDPVQPSTAFGTAAVPDNTRQIQVTASADYGWWTERWVPVISEQFQADFANPGNGWRESEIGYFGEGGADDIYVGGEVRANLWDFDNDQVQAIWHSCNPRIIIVRNNDRIEAVCFPVGSELVIELDDPANGVGVDWDSGAPVVVERDPDKPWETLVVFELGDYTAPDEAVVTATATPEEGDPVVVTTEVIPFTIDLVDSDNDTISGTAPEGSEVLVEANDNWRYPVADATNTWLADFSEPGDQPGEENPVDLGPGSEGGATLLDEAGSATTIAWRISNAQFQVAPAAGSIWANEFESNGEITITIGATDFGPYPLDEWGNFDGNNYGLTFEVPAGTDVTIDDGTTTKTHTVTNLVVTGVDPVTDVVSGRAVPGSSVDVWEHWEGNQVSVVACDDSVEFPCDGDEPGTWHADFSGVFDLVPGVNGNSGQCDDDNDCTNAGWWIPNARFNVSPADENIGGNEFLADTELTILVGGVAVPGGPYSTDGEGNFGIGFDPAELDLMAGDLVSVSDGTTTKTHTVTELVITGVDPGTDVVSGTAEPGSAVDVWVHDTDSGLTVTACDDSPEFPCDGDPVGTWHADFTAQVDLVGGSNGNSSQCDTENDCTDAGWSIPNAAFGVYPANDRIDGREFQASTELTILVNGAAMPGGPYSTDESGNFTAGGDEIVFDLAAGDLVSVSDGTTTKLHTITELVLTGVDPDTDVVWGTAEPGSAVDVWVHDTDAGLTVTACDDSPEFPCDGDPVGTWHADFTDQTDVVPGSNGNSGQCDVGNDCTHAEWSVPNAQYGVYPAADRIDGRQFAESTELTILVNGVAMPGGPYATDEWGNFTAGGDPIVLDLAAGDLVSISDGTTTKVHTVTELVITGVDPVTDVVSGTAEPGSIVDVWVHEADAWLQVTACDDSPEFPCDGDPMGTWHADFTAQTDVVPGSNGNSGQCDVDSDCTHAEWWALNPTFTVETPTSVWSSNQDWELGDTITLTIADPGFPGPLTTTVVPNEGDPENHGWYLELDGFEIQPGHVVTVTDGEHTKVLTVVDLTIEAVSGDDDTVSGWLFDENGEPMADVPVEVNVDNEHGNFHRAAVVQPDGYWVADFSVPGDGEGDEALPVEIEPNTGISAQVFDDDADSTHRGDCFECDGGEFQIEPIEIEHGDVLISETDGTLWQYRPETGELIEHPLPFGGVWDIQWVWGDTLFIANSGDGLLWALHLPSGELGPIEDDLFGFPIGMSIQSSDPVGWNPEAAWIADGQSGILRMDDSGVTQIVEIEGTDGIVVAPDGSVYFTDLSGSLYVVDETEPGNYREVVHVEGYSLNGLIMLPDGNVLATSMGPAALITIDPSDGSFTVDEYQQMWSPEDSAIGRTGEIYVIDSGYVNNFGDESGLFARESDGTLVQLIDNDDFPNFGDTVDVLVVGPWVTATKEASQSEVFFPGEPVTFDVTVHNGLGPFGLISLDGLDDTVSGDLMALEGCLAQDLASGESYTCTYELFVAGDVTNEVTARWADEWGVHGESVASAEVRMTNPAILIEKIAASESGAAGDGIAVEPGAIVTWQYVVTNVGDVDLVDIVVSDPSVGEVCAAAALPVGDTLICTHESEAELGWHTNTGDVVAVAVDADGDAKTIEATDDSSYIGMATYVTSSSLCLLDSGEFRLNFKKDKKAGSGYFSVNSTNPGQFYMNVLVANDGTGVGLEIPYPFVTKGAKPLHVYEGMSSDGDCLTPMGELGSYRSKIKLRDYQDTNGDGIVGFGDVYILEVPADEAFEFVTLHLDYGLKKTKGWVKDGSDAINDPAVNPDLAGVEILNGTEHRFMVRLTGTPIDGSEGVVRNINRFK